jgi:hypothetical protein
MLVDRGRERLATFERQASRNDVLSHLTAVI